MIDSFLTVEDINTCKYNNQGIYWYELNITLLPNEEFSNIKLDFCNISYSKNRTRSGTLYEHYYQIEVENDMWTHSLRVYNENEQFGGVGQVSGNTIHIYSHIKILKVYLLMASFPVELETWYYGKVSPEYFKLNFKELNTPQDIYFENVYNKRSFHKNCNLDKGYNLVLGYGLGTTVEGYVYVDLLKTDFQFNCMETLTVGKINKIQLGTDTDYLPDGDMIGNNTPTIKIRYGNKLLPVTYDETLNDYVFQLDLSDRTNEGYASFTVLVEANDVINSTETSIRLPVEYESISTLTELTNLFTNGGTGRLGSNITLTSDLTLTKDVLIVGNDKTITCNGNKIIVPSGKTFKAMQANFTGGANTIQQDTGSIVELTECSFSNCTGLGSVIDCQVDIDSLDNPSDFTTNITGCTFTNCDMIILHGGDLTVTNCTIEGKIGNKSYPFFLYQIDGNAELTHNTFQLTSNTQIESDIEFNACIFKCGENAQINGLTHYELQNNNLQSFLQSPQRNTSLVDITYKYDLIDDYINLSSDNGYCHSVSNVDFVFKTNITITREE